MLSGYYSPSLQTYVLYLPVSIVSKVAETMRCNRFDEILRYLHVADNTAMSDTDHIIDDSTIPYFGRHSAKQFIRGKPIRFSYKLWVVADPAGYIFHLNPYCVTCT
ncbi:hypothetical protein PR048_013720 [Dryococelus australis]|uniref:PiggyBac transposable element-derived protein domain-containing protein n=1 Tax=Dryococelus australis TaxID=614101 RepID=A0ABQ9HSY5_9NEOP|nr:hypothetical protein PR048_013720 [Dryococelus australis]